MLYTTFKFGWGRCENGWSLFAVGVMSALVQGVLLGRLLKRFSPQRLAIAGLVSSTLAYVGWGAASEGWMMFAVIICNVLGFTVAASIQSIISGAADATTQGRTMGAVSGLQSLMAVVAPVLGAPLLGVVSHLPRGDWRIGAPFYFCAAAPARGAGAGLAPLQRGTAQPRRRRHALPAPPDPMHDKILILDFGSQVTQLIARRVREAHVFCEIHPNDVSDEFVREFAPKGIILSGSHASTYEEHELRAPQGGVRARRAGARHLLRHVHDGGAARRRGRGEHAPRVRLRRGAGARPHPAARAASRTSRRPRATACSRSG